MTNDGLEVRGLTRRFGGIVAVNDVGFTATCSEILGLIGPNGAGKTTLFNLVSGVLKPTSGTITFLGENVTGKPIHAIARRGLTRTFQLTNLFERMTVLENMLVATHLHESSSFRRAIFGRMRNQQLREQRAHEHALEILDQVGLAEVAPRPCGQLAHGTKRLLSTAMALAPRPRMLLLDEPLSGLADVEIDRMLALCRRVRDDGIGLIIVEHNIAALLGLCDRMIVLNFGNKIAEGDPNSIRNNEAVITAYLGGSTVGAATPAAVEL